MSFDINKIRADFPILAREVNGRPLVYLDNGASAQKPQAVIDKVTKSYAHEYANVHRGLHSLSMIATEAYEAVREKLAKFLGAASSDSIIMNTGTTESINMISYGWAAPRLQAGDEIILTTMEHHANIVPWHFLRERQGVKLVWVDPDADGSLDPQKILDAITDRTRLIAVTHMSNVLGTVVDVSAICKGAKERGVPVLVDGSQAAVHMPVDVDAMGCDFYAVTGHKLYGPSASGGIYVAPDRMAEMRPFMGGGDMIRSVAKEAVTYADAPLKFEAGTPSIVPQIGLGAALDYLSDLGMEAVAAHEAAVGRYAAEQLEALPFLQIQGRAPGKGAIFSFTMDGPGHPHDISTILDKQGIAVRAGQHCCEPLMNHLGVAASARASFALYSTKHEVDALVDGLKFCHEIFG